MTIAQQIQAIDAQATEAHARLNAATAKLDAALKAAVVAFEDTTQGPQSQRLREDLYDEACAAARAEHSKALDAITTEVDRLTQEAHALHLEEHQAKKAMLRDFTEVNAPKKSVAVKVGIIATALALVGVTGYFGHKHFTRE